MMLKGKKNTSNKWFNKKTSIFDQFWFIASKTLVIYISFNASSPHGVSVLNCYSCVFHSASSEAEGGGGRGRGGSNEKHQGDVFFFFTPGLAEISSFPRRSLPPTLPQPMFFFFFSITVSVRLLRHPGSLWTRRVPTLSWRVNTGYRLAVCFR